MATTKPEGALVVIGEGRWEITLLLAPVPAARPRVGRFGTYYPKTYARWKKEAADYLRPFWKTADPTDQPVFVTVHSVVKRPQKLTRRLPNGDVDNYAKSALDAITGSQLIWMDDKQVALLLSTKRYATPGEEPHVIIKAALDPESLFYRGSGEDVYDLPPDLRLPIEEIENAR